MAKVTGPAFSVDAHGELGGGICYTGCKSGHRVILTPKPGNPNSASQAAHRASFHSAKSAWKLLSPASKAALNAEADLLHMTGYNLYIKRALLGEISLPGWVEDSYEGQVAASLDDARVWYNGSIWQCFPYNNGSDVGHPIDILYRDGTGMRFLTVDSPVGAVVLTAHLHLTCDNWGNNAGVWCKIVGDKEANANPFSNLVDYQSRRGTSCGGANNDLRTLAEVAWHMPAAIGDDEEIESPDISAVIQEILDLPGRVVGGAIAVFCDDHDDVSPLWQAYGFYSYDGAPAHAGRLHFTYKYWG